MLSKFSADLAVWIIFWLISYNFICWAHFEIWSFDNSLTEVERAVSIYLGGDISPACCFKLSRRDLDCAGNFVSNKMYLFTSLVVLTIFPPEDWLRSANLSGLSDVFWSTGMTNISWFSTGVLICCGDTVSTYRIYSRISRSRV